MRWKVHKGAEIQAFTATLGPERMNPPNWPDEERKLVPDRPGFIDEQLRFGWKTEQWASAPDAWQARVWPTIADEIRRGLELALYARQQVFPVVRAGRLALRPGAELGRDPLIPPTAEGWARYLALAPDSDHNYTELDQAASRWWGRGFPRGLLRRGAHEEEP